MQETGTHSTRREGGVEGEEGTEKKEGRKVCTLKLRQRTSRGETERDDNESQGREHGETPR